MQILPDIQYDGYIIRVYEHIDRNNWAYTIYKVNQITLGNSKWKRVRAMEHYIEPQKAEQAAKNYINNFLNKKS